MKVLLMVEREGRVVCASRRVGFDPAERMLGERWLPGCGYYVWWTAHDTAINASRWWLVEAASADAARETIRASAVARALMAKPGMTTIAGRILASGGRDA